LCGLVRSKGPGDVDSVRGGVVRGLWGRRYTGAARSARSWGPRFVKKRWWGGQVRRGDIKGGLSTVPGQRGGRGLFDPTNLRPSWGGNPLHTVTLSRGWAGGIGSTMALGAKKKTPGTQRKNSSERENPEGHPQGRCLTGTICRGGGARQVTGGALGRPGVNA